jgi:eukaryotic-like serine/threonine-protein kinase
VLKLIGKRLNGRYQLIEWVGGGGMATVYKAKDVILDRIVAVKVLRAEYGEDEEFIRRFHREAHSATSLMHENIVSVFDAGEDEDIHYIVMEYINGYTLKQYIEENKPLALEKVIHIMTQLTDAISNAHENDIVHRDIKPQNILIDDENHIKVTDFGIALASSTYTITHTNTVLGSVHYLSPEQARGGIANVKSDVYSLGIVLFELLTGELPFSGESPVSVALKHLQGNVPAVRNLNPTIPQSLENIILKAMAKDPIHRYHTVKEMESDLKTALHPSRKDEAKFTIPAVADDHTKVLPVIKKEKEDENEKEHPRRKKEIMKWAFPSKKVLIITGILFFIVLSGVFASTIVPKLFAADDVIVPSVVGMKLEDAENLLKDKQLKVSSQVVFDESLPEGHIVSQIPNAQSLLQKLDYVKVTVSAGKKPIVLNKYVGKNINEVLEQLKEIGIKNIEVIQEINEDYPEGTIFKQEPRFGEEFSTNKDTLLLYLSEGPKQIELANLLGLPQAKVYAYIAEQNLSIIHKDDYSNTVEKGAVISQNPEFGTFVETGTEIEVVFSKGPSPQQPITVTKEFTIEIENENKEYEIEIYFTDANFENSLYEADVISQNKTYRIPLTINPGGSATYQVLIDGNLERSIKVNYEDVNTN